MRSFISSPYGACTMDQVIHSSAGFEGWSSSKLQGSAPQVSDARGDRAAEQAMTQRDNDVLITIGSEVAAVLAGTSGRLIDSETLIQWSIQLVIWFDSSANKARTLPENVGHPQRASSDLMDLR